MRQHVMPTDQQGHIGPEAGEDVHHLHPGHAGSDDDQLLGQFGEVIRMASREDSISIDRGPGRLPGP